MTAVADRRERNGVVLAELDPLSVGYLEADLT